MSETSAAKVGAWRAGRHARSCQGLAGTQLKIASSPKLKGTIENAWHSHGNAPVR
jgi:hypothetical protein